MTVKELKKWLDTKPEDAEVRADVYTHNKRREVVIVNDYKDGKTVSEDLTVYLSEEEE